MFAYRDGRKIVVCDGCHLPIAGHVSTPVGYTINQADCPTYVRIFVGSGQLDFHSLACEKKFQPNADGRLKVEDPWLSPDSVAAKAIAAIGTL